MERQTRQVGSIDADFLRIRYAVPSLIFRLNQVLHIGDGVHPTTLIGQHRGQWGDREWHTTPVAEPDDFYRHCCTGLGTLDLGRPAIGAQNVARLFAEGAGSFAVLHEQRGLLRPATVTVLADRR